MISHNAPPIFYYENGEGCPETLRTGDVPVKKDSKDDGENCKLCKDWFYLAAPNQEDGKFLCRACQFDPYRSSPLNPEE